MATPKRVWSSKKTTWNGKEQVWLKDGELKKYDGEWRDVEGDIQVYDSQWETLSGDAELDTYDSNSPEFIGTVEDGIEAAFIFKDWNGTVLKSGKVKDGETPVPPADPTREPTAEYSYTFSGWNPAVGPISKSTEYIAQYESTPNNYTVSIESNDVDYGTVDTNSVVVTYGTSITESSNTLTIGGTQITATAISGYEFVNWTANGESLPATVTGNITIVANFQASAPVEYITINTTLTTTQVEVGQLAQIYFLANDTFTIGETSQWLSNTELVSESGEGYNYIYKGTVTASGEHTFTVTGNTTGDSDSIVITCTNPTPPSDYVNIIGIYGEGGYEGEEQIIYVDASGSITATSDDVMVAEIGSIDDTPGIWTDPDTGTEYNYTHSVNLSTHDAGTCHIHIELSSDPNVYAEQEITVWPIWETKYEGTAGTVMWNNLDNCIEIGHNVVDPDDGSISVESVRYTNYIIETDGDTAEDFGPAYFQWGNCTAFRGTIPNTNTQVDLSNLSQDDLDNIASASYYSPDFVTNATSWATPLADIETTGLANTWIAEPAPLEGWRLPFSGEIDVINAFRNEAMQDQDWNDEYLGILHYMYLNIAGIVDPTCTLDPNENTHYWTSEVFVDYDPSGLTPIGWNIAAFYYDDTLGEFTYGNYAPTNGFCLIGFQDVI